MSSLLLRGYRGLSLGRNVDRFKDYLPYRSLAEWVGRNPVKSMVGVAGLAHPKVRQPLFRFIARAGPQLASQFVKNQVTNVKIVGGALGKARTPIRVPPALRVASRGVGFGMAALLLYDVANYAYEYGKANPIYVSQILNPDARP